MAKRQRHTPEQIISKLREAEVKTAKGTAIAQACKDLAVTEQTKDHGQVTFVKGQHTALKAILDDPKVVPLLNHCRPITTPTHSAIPVVRFVTGMPLAYAVMAASMAAALPGQSGAPPGVVAQQWWNSSRSRTTKRDWSGVLRLILVCAAT